MDQGPDNEPPADNAATAAAAPTEATGAELQDELPVVARLVVEIRSDGRRTVARGAIEDRVTGQDMAIELRAGSLWGLARGMVDVLRSVPALARSMARRVAPGRRSVGPRGSSSR